MIPMSIGFSIPVFIILATFATASGIEVYSADDGSGVDSILIFIDGNLRSSEEFNNLPEAIHTMDWSTYPEATGWHTLTARATDAAGNNSHDAIVVLVDKRGVPE